MTHQRQVHLDFHTSPHIPVVASELDVPQFAQTVRYGYNNAFGGNYAWQAAYGGKTGSIPLTTITRTSEVVMVMDYKDASALHANPTEAFGRYLSPTTNPTITAGCWVPAPDRSVPFCNPAWNPFLS